MTPLAHVGIVGGGQLGRMMIYRAKKLGMKVSVLEAESDAPAAAIADRFVSGSLYDEAAIRELGRGCDVVTYEIEHLSVDALEELEREGCPVHPSPSVLRIIQDKLIQKQTLERAGIALPRFAEVVPQQSVEATAEEIRNFGLPCVQKARTGGYDGRGVAVLETEQDLESPLEGATMVEDLIDVETELAIIVGRAVDGETAIFPPVGMRFRPGANVLEWLEAPAEIPEGTALRAREEAVRAVEALGGVGVFAVELFVERGGRILVNEIAPRPHNSGHFTIEACATDQFEQHLRAVCGLPLGSTNQLSPAVMLNLLGEPGYRGTPVVEGLDDILRMEGVEFHWYGKRETRPHRKMGHVTILDRTIEGARERAAIVERLLKIKGETTDE